LNCSDVKASFQKDYSYQQSDVNPLDTLIHEAKTRCYNAPTQHQQGRKVDIIYCKYEQNVLQKRRKNPLKSSLTDL
jgi:hypothetical protein